MENEYKREYKITKGSLGYHVYRTRTIEGIEEIEWLQKTTYTLNKNHARTFYHISDAESALIIARRRWLTGTTSNEKEKSELPREKQSWSDF